MKKLSVLLMVLALVGCSSNTATPTTKTGTGEVETDSDKTTVTVTMEGDKLTSVYIDQANKGEAGKKELKEDYNMKGVSPIGKEWYEQAEFLEKYMVDNNTIKLDTDEKGHPVSEDVLAGCTIAITDILEAANKAVEAAK